MMIFYQGFWGWITRCQPPHTGCMAHCKPDPWETRKHDETCVQSWDVSLTEMFDMDCTNQIICALRVIWLCREMDIPPNCNVAMKQDIQHLSSWILTNPHRILYTLILDKPTKGALPSSWNFNGSTLRFGKTFFRWPWSDTIEEANLGRHGPLF